MAYDEQLAKRLSKLVAQRSDFYEQKMFGGVGFLLRGNMCFGIYKDYLILRLGSEQAQKALKKSHTKPFDITGRVMKGWVMVASEGIQSQTSLKQWITPAIDFVSQLPRK